MKKLITGFSFTVIFIFSIYVSFKMMELPPVYKSMTKIVTTDTMYNSSMLVSILFRYRWFDIFLCLITLLFAAAIIIYLMYKSKISKREVHVMIYNYIASFMLILGGILILVVNKNLIKLIMGICIMIYGIAFLLITVADRVIGGSPYFINRIVNEKIQLDPVPQAITICLIIVGTVVIAMSLFLTVKIHSHYETINYDNIKGAGKK